MKLSYIIPVAILPLIIITFFSCAGSPVDPPPVNPPPIVPPDPTSPINNNDTPETILLTSEIPDGSFNYLIVYNNDGSIRWQRKDSINYDLTHRDIDACYADGVLYIGAGFFRYQPPDYTTYISYLNFFAIDVKTGNNIWSKEKTAEAIYCPYVKETTMYCCIVRGNVRFIAALDATNGNLLWEKRTNFPFPSAYFQADQNTLYFVTPISTTENNVMAMDLMTKTIKWSVPIGINLVGTFSELVLTQNTVLVSNSTGTLSAIDKNTGSVKWKSSDPVKQPVLGRNNTILASNDKTIFCYDIETGISKWTWKIEGNNSRILGRPTVTNNNVYILLSKNGLTYIVSLDASTGQEKNSLAISGFTRSHLTVGNNLFLVMEDPILNFKLVRYDIPTGLAKDSIMISGHTNYSNPMVIGTSGDVYY